VGVAFLLVCALRKAVREIGGFPLLPEPPLRPYLDLVALGTVADMAVLRGGTGSSSGGDPGDPEVAPPGH